MSLKSTIRAGVDTAFRSLSDLVQIATFDEELVSGFDFVGGDVNSTLELKAVEMIPIEHVTADGSTIRTKFIARSIDFDISKYSVFTVNSIKYQIESFESYEGAHILTAARLSNV